MFYLVRKCTLEAMAALLGEELFCTQACLGFPTEGGLPPCHRRGDWDSANKEQNLDLNPGLSGCKSSLGEGQAVRGQWGRCSEIHTGQKGHHPGPAHQPLPCLQASSV